MCCAVHIPCTTLPLRRILLLAVVYFAILSFLALILIYKEYFRSSKQSGKCQYEAYKELRKGSRKGVGVGWGTLRGGDGGAASIGLALLL